MENLTNPYKSGQKLTIINVSSSAFTSKRQVQIVRVQEPTPRLRYVNGPVDGYRFGTFKDKGKRKEFYLDIDLGALVFDSWDVPILIDSEIPGRNCFSGNACCNITWDAAKLEGWAPESRNTFLREYIESNNLNPYLTDSDKARIVIPGDSYDDGELLYPEIETGHAVIERIKERMAATA